MNKLYDAWKDKLQSNSDILGGEVVFPGTRLSVNHIGGMMNKKNRSLKEITEDYSSLTIDDLVFAEKYFKEHFYHQM